MYGGVTGGLFSALQSLGATMVAPSLFTTLMGSGTAMAGTLFGFSSSTKDGPPAEEPQDEPDLG